MLALKNCRVDAMIERRLLARIRLLCGLLAAFVRHDGMITVSIGSRVEDSSGCGGLRVMGIERSMLLADLLLWIKIKERGSPWEIG